MECCAEVQKCNMDNKFYNEQKDKYGKVKEESQSKIVSKGSEIRGGGNSGNEQVLLQENIWLNTKVE